MYQNISTFATDVGYRTGLGTPFSYCLYPNNNSQFLHGSGTASNLLYSPSCEPCQQYMSEYCSQNWHTPEGQNVCQIYYDNNKDTAWPNMGGVDVASHQMVSRFLRLSPTNGENLIRNALEKRFFAYPSVRANKQIFDPNMPSSPFYTQPIMESSKPFWRINPYMYGQVHDGDFYTQKMLEHYDVCWDLLLRFYQIYTRDPLAYRKLSGSRSNSELTRFLESHRPVFVRLLQSFPGLSQSIFASTPS